MHRSSVIGLSAANMAFFRHMIRFFRCVVKQASVFRQAFRCSQLLANCGKWGKVVHSVSVGIFCFHLHASQILISLMVVSFVCICYLTEYIFIL